MNNNDGRASHVTKQSSDVTETSVLSQLAGRCEKAMGPDRELDVAITIATGIVDSSIDPRFVKNMRPDPDDVGWVLYEYENEKYTDRAKSFTGSLNAAKKLIPDDHDYILEHINGGLTIGARVGHNNPDRTSWGETDELALCAASLRAHAALLASKEEQNV